MNNSSTSTLSPSYAVVMNVSVLSGLNGHEVQQISVAYELRVLFDSGERVYVDVTNFRFIDATGGQWEVRVEDDPVTAGPVLGLRRDRVTGAHVDDWELTLLFDSGARIICPPDPDYEAWAVSIPGGTWHCRPGGGPDSPH